ncbi:MAG: nicotinate (nicotinamide) nucleotide adenylyltransferase [Acidobacteria bacterium]|nr:nicotinate (nicotinamide) nucleotide adenylyltransferase [Acidobacteriota bacterium]
MSPGIVGVLGGTFDPIHRGHLDVARAAHDALGLERILLMPAHVPPHRHRAPHASAYHRFAMTALAAQDAPYLVADDAELRVDGPSYTAHTLARLATTGYAPSQIVFITGVDAFAEIATWFDYPRVLDAAHFAVVTRPGHGLDLIEARLGALRPRFAPPQALRDAPAANAYETRVFLIDAPTSDVSSTSLRAALAAGGDVAALVTPPVHAHIVRHGLYRPSLSQAGRLHEES